MLNKLWPWMIGISIFFAFFSGRIEQVNEAIFKSLEDTTTMIIGLAGVMCFWNGIVKILVNTSIIKKLEKVLNPFVSRVYKHSDSKIKGLITINMVSNMMGLGNAATPVGIRAMKEMDSKKREEKMSREMCLFVLMNCLSIQILPGTIISIMASLGDNNSGRIVVPIWIVSSIVFCITMGVGLCLFQD